MPLSTKRLPVMLGLLAAVGPFAIDMYLPAFPAIAEDFGVSINTVQFSLTSYFAATALSQLVYGPVSDTLGRKTPLYFGLLLYIAAAIGCGLSTSVGMLIGLRFIQGVGGCAATVITRAIVRDLHTGPAAARLLATIMLVFSISPMLAPIAGSSLAEFVSWRSIFAVIAVIGVLAFLLALFILPETRPAEKRTRGKPSAVFRRYGQLLRNGRFMATALIGGSAQASFFAYLGGSAGLYQEHYGLSPIAYSGMFALNAVAFIGGAQTNSFLAHRFGIERLVLTAVTTLAVAVSLLVGVFVAGLGNFAILSGLLFVSFACLGSIIPAAAVLALDPHGPIAGTAAALMGTIQLSCGAGSIALISLFSSDTPLPMIVTIGGFGLVSFALSWLTLRVGKAHTEEEMEAVGVPELPNAPVPIEG